METKQPRLRRNRMMSLGRIQVQESCRARRVPGGCASHRWILWSFFFLGEYWCKYGLHACILIQKIDGLWCIMIIHSDMFAWKTTRSTLQKKIYHHISMLKNSNNMMLMHICHSMKTCHLKDVTVKTTSKSSRLYWDQQIIPSGMLIIQPHKKGSVLSVRCLLAPKK